MTDRVGTYICYEKRTFSDKDLLLIDQANKILESYEARKIGLTLRGLYYQFVSRDMFSNETENYNRLKRVISRGRIAGLVSWTAVEDRGRALMGGQAWDSPLEALRTARETYGRDLWSSQEYRPEVWVEKQAQEGIIGTVCDELRVDYFATKGYNSQSEQWRAGRRLAGYVQHGQRPVVFYLGDHDPSGMDMTRDNQERLSMFAGVPVMVARIALNWDQIQKYNPPPNPLKTNARGDLTDSRAEGYRAEFGSESWELDALDPSVIHNLIRDAVLKVRDDNKWQEALAAEADDKDELDTIIEEQE